MLFLREGSDDAYAQNFVNTKARFLSAGSGPLCFEDSVSEFTELKSHVRQSKETMMILPFKKYSRSDFPLLDFSELDYIGLEDFIRVIGLDAYLTLTEHGWWKGKCPLHPQGDGTIVLNSYVDKFACRGCQNPFMGNIIEFAFRILGVAHKVEAEIWLLQFRPSQKETVLKTWGEKIASITSKTRNRVECAYDPEGYFERQRYRNLSDEIVRGDHNRLLDVVVSVIENDQDISSAVNNGELRERFYRAVAAHVEKRSRK